MPSSGWGSRKYHSFHFGACWEPSAPIHCAPGYYYIKYDNNNGGNGNDK
jgi:hypothetical protein